MNKPNTPVDATFVANAAEYISSALPSPEESETSQCAIRPEADGEEPEQLGLDSCGD